MKPLFFRVLRAGLLGFLFLAGGCATLPATRPLGALQQEQGVALFRESMAQQQKCPSCIDAQVRLSLKSLVQNGTISGFIQAKAPAFLKFTGLNPLGQPMMFLATDGNFFRYVAVPEGKGYEGLVTAAAFKKYAPPGFAPEQGFFWLTGRMASARVRIFSVAEDPEDHGLWLELAYADDAADGEPLRHHVLFDPGQQVIRRHLVVDAEGRIMVDVWYENYTTPSESGEDTCRLPGLVRIHANNNGAVMELTLGDWLYEANFSAGDFRVDLPAGFQLVPVE
ncbi:hypothetical protein [Thiovibrio frasassiensis]|uniref:Uncharacterized protein n=1 Tax=Thiovibrio frasassiensis TaxID=2984131 RepID=A0A9X4MII6_9BACT|nr:hypothetical protein [Thiovibrio frasassiensis]MDG4476996.1 hypothetical protein [Thiovibrio frasassiensis]